MELYDYQQQVIDQLRHEMARLLSIGKRPRVMLQLPTGAGKTVVASELMRGAARKRTPTLFVAHRSELIYQTSDKLTRFGVPHGLIIPSESRPVGHTTLVGTIQSVTSRARSNRIDYPDLKFVFVDEAHRAAATSYRDLIETYPEAFVVGLSATPVRTDGRGLGDVFNSIIQGPSIDQLTAMGRLVPVRYFAPESYDLTGVRTRGGDFVDSDLDAAVNKTTLVGNIVVEWQRIAGDRKTVVFASSVAHSRAIARRFQECGIRAAHIDGETKMDERRQILSDLSDGTIQVVCNCQILTEGWDQPDVSCIVLARPTKSVAMYLQIAGRALRPSPGKTDCVIIDHTGTCQRLGAINEYTDWHLSPSRGEGVQRKSTGGVVREPKPCPQCAALISPAPACPECGYEFPRSQRAEDPLETDDQLIELFGVGKSRGKKQEWTQAQKQRFYAELLGYARQKNYNHGWAYHQYRQRMGVGPAGARPEPVEPSPSTIGWIKSQQIRYHYGRSKREAYAGR